MLQDVEALGIKKGFTIEKNNFHNISLGQGQEKVAENAIELSSNLGHWVMLQVNLKLLITVIKLSIILFYNLCLKERASSKTMAANIG